MSLVNHPLDVLDVQTMLTKVYLDTVGAPSSDLHYAYSDDEACELRDRLREVGWIHGDHWALTRAGALHAAELAQRGWDPFPPDTWTNRQEQGDALVYLDRVKARAQEMHAASNQGPWDSLDPELQRFWIDVADSELRPRGAPAAARAGDR